MGIRDRLRKMVRKPSKAPSRHRWLLDLSAHRDGQIYHPQFGTPHRMSIEPAPMSRLHAVVPAVDPRWEHTGVYAYPPHRARSAWLSVTTGLSNPWHGALPPPVPDDPARHRSGAGIELCLLTPRRASWAADVLNAVMARQQCIASGVLKGEILAVGDVIRAEGLRMPRTPPPPPPLAGFLVAHPRGLPEGFVLPYGRVSFRLLVGITAAQQVRLAAEGAEAILAETDGITGSA